MEIWKPVVGYEGLYEVSNFGRIRTCDNYIRAILNGIETKSFRRSKIRKTCRNDSGYHRLTLWKNNIQKCYCVHFLVATAFIGPRPKGLTINHKDGDKLNNYSDNLEYITVLQNIFHSIRLGLWSPVGSKNSNSKLKESDIVSIRAKYASGHVTKAALAKEYNVAPSHIGLIIKCKFWKHV